MRRDSTVPARRVAVVAAATALLGTLAAPVTVAAAPAASSEHVIVVFDAPPGRAAARAVAAAGGEVRLRLGLINALAVEMPAAAVARLAAAPGVSRVEPDHPLTALDHGPDTGDLEYENAWGVEHIGSKPVHDAGIRGSGVKVAVIDTGIDYIHDDPDDDPYVVDPEFNSNYRGGYDFVNNDTDPMDDNGHGTHVAGILAAEKNGYLVVGVAPAVDLYALKILDATGNGEYSTLIAALGWAVDHDIDVVNMSLGGHEASDALQAAVNNAAAGGVTMVAASGNVVTLQDLFYGCPVAYPAAYDKVLSTTFTNQNDALTGYSCTGPQVDFASPGDQIFSPVPTGACMFCKPWGYSAESGTSMASPHLAGTVALLLDAGLADANGNGYLDDARARLCATANPGWGVQSGFGQTRITTSDPRYKNWFGCGVIDADEAVLGLLPPPPPTANQPPVAGDDSATTPEDTPINVAVLANDTDANGDPLSVLSVSDPPHGSVSINPDGTVRYAPDANYNGVDTFGYTVSDGTATDDGAVSMTVSAVNDPPDAVNDPATTPFQTPVSIAVLANDTDIDGAKLVVQSTSTPANGTAVVNADGTVTYAPNAGFSGVDAFTYTLSDSAGGTDSATVSVTVGAAPVSNAIHVGDLDGSTAISGKNWTATVTTRIDDAAHAPVSGAIVTGQWSAGATGTASCTTGASGTCSVQKTKLPRSSVASVTLTIVSVTKSGRTYAPGSNHDPDPGPDSTGTAIVVPRPA